MLKIKLFISQTVYNSCGVPRFCPHLTLFLKGIRIPPARVFGVWELDMTSERAEIFIRWTMSIVRLVNGEKVPNKYQRAMPLSLEVHTLELPIEKRAKCRKIKNDSNLTTFDATGPRFCTPPMVHKNGQLFFDQTIMRPNQTVEWLPDPGGYQNDR